MTAGSPVAADALLEEARDLLPEIRKIRRTIHRHPEVGLHLPATQAVVLEALHGLPLEITLGTNLTSVIARLDGASPGPTVLLRADMDALPMTEETGLDFASDVPDAAHMCGHDAHTAMLVGAARMLAARRGQLAGRVLFMFQPGEEGYHGARHMLEEGLLDPEVTGGEVSHAFFLHQLPLAPSGTVLTRQGPALAAVDTFTIRLRGRGGHASAPHQALDPVPVACELVMALQTLVTRRVSVFDPGVLTVTQINAGSATNVIPDEVTIRGTIRTLSERTRTTIRDGAEQLARGIGAAHGLEVDVRLVRGYPVTHNDPSFTQHVHDLGSRLLGDGKVRAQRQPTMGAEDFSYVLEQVPGTVAFLGTCPPGTSPADAEPLHSTRMVLDEGAMAVGTALYVAVALEELGHAVRPADGDAAAG